MVKLSSRQLEIYTLIYERHFSYQRVAEWLHVKPSTVHDHTKVIREKYRKAGMPLRDNRVTLCN